MTNTQLAEYKKLHSKLAYNLKTANTDEAKEVWGTAMKSSRPTGMICWRNSCKIASLLGVLN